MPQGTRVQSTRGRKRDQSRTHAILIAARDLLMEVGFDAVRIQDVATRAGVGLATIYRRWPGKSELLADVIREVAPGDDVPLSGDPKTDLLRMVEVKVAMIRANPGLMPGLVSAIRSDPTIAEAVRDQWLSAPFRTVLEELVPEHPALEALIEMIPAVLTHRSLLLGEVPDAAELVESVLLLAGAPD